MMNRAKLTITAVGAALTAWLGILAIPIYVLVLMNVADYVTGLVAAPYRGQRRSSDIGFRGIAKKVSMWVLVGIGATIDWLAAYTATTVGVTLTLGCPAGAAVAVWLICNEIISILENIGDIGVKLPGFLRTLVLWVADETEKIGNPMEEVTKNDAEINTTVK